MHRTQLFVARRPGFFLSVANCRTHETRTHFGPTPSGGRGETWKYRDCRNICIENKRGNNSWIESYVTRVTDYQWWFSKGTFIWTETNTICVKIRYRIAHISTNALISFDVFIRITPVHTSPYSWTRMPSLKVEGWI